MGLPRGTWLVLTLLPFMDPAAAQESEECLLCHEEADLTGERDGRQISVFVSAAALDGSVHRGFACIDCHQDLAGADMHDETVEPVDCGACHDDVIAEVARSRHGRLASGSRFAPGCADCHGYHDVASPGERPPDCASCHDQARLHARSLHGQAAARGDPLAPTCADCHRGHEILPASDRESPTAVMNVPVLCGRCHREGSEVSLNREISQDQILENYSMSIHGQGLYEQGLTVTAVCSSCHTAHDILDHTDPRSSIHHDNVAKTCAKCHGQIEQVHRQVIEGRLWLEAPHKIPACVDCHPPHKIRRVLYPAGSADKDCLACHSDTGLTMERDGRTVSLYVDGRVVAASAHGATACAQCHVDVTPSLSRPCETVAEPVDCGICHSGPVDEYRSGIHGRLWSEGDPDAPSCLHCHGKHDVLKKDVPASPTFALKVPYLCAGCHRAGEKAAVRIDSGITDIFDSYIDSIHGKGLVASGLLVTANCADCHTAHGELPVADPRSSVNHDNVGSTCGTCHHGIEETFRSSIHMPDGPDPEHRYPSCEDCHTSHTIGRTDKPGFRFLMMDQCGRCHETEAETFFDTFHGKVSRLGSEGAAKCYDCHGTHNILPTSNPASTLGRTHVVETCGQCHEGSHRRFAGYLTHATHHDPDRYPALFWSFRLMTALLIGTLSFALLHTFAWLFRLYRSKDEWQAHKARAAAAANRPAYRRFDRYNRMLHLLMVISFFTLALTGMALKFSYMGWAQGLSTVLGGFESMGTLHRLGAVLLFGVCVAHLYRVRQLVRTGAQSFWQLITGPDSILFTRRDLREFWQSIRWFFGRGPRPRYGRYTYWEKFDYFAVAWGVVIIGSTGLLLWFPELFTRVLPGWFINVATIVHSDEALLAVGFIFTIHFFNTHFRLDKFPMDPVIFTGRVPVEELRFDKPDEYDRLVREGRLKTNLAEPVPARVEKIIRFFAFLALTIGLVLIVLIVYTMLFGYR